MRPRAPVRTTALAALACLVACGDAPPSADVAADAVPVAESPPGTDIWLASLSVDPSGALAFAEPVNVTARPGYDNQPSFTPDGSAFYYTVIDDAGQADIWRYELSDGTARAVTTTSPESEYSGTPLPTGPGFSAVRVEADSTQRLWSFDPEGGDARVLLPRIAPVGYHAWVGADTLILFVLGDPATLQIATVSSGVGRELDRGIGRSIQPIPGTREISYVRRLEGGASEIRRLDPATGTNELVVAGVEGSDFHAWTPNGVLLQAHGSKVYAFRPGGETGWAEVADFSALGLSLSRLAVSPDGTVIALVGEAGAG